MFLTTVRLDGLGDEVWNDIPFLEPGPMPFTKPSPSECICAIWF